ncbi:MobV family relaxase [Sphingomonas sp. NFX23]|uniref:MobV family relaxase n=1 Tax=Sphingomonas sp. NFX23 TaxID=2819532 RepID=UPI003CF0EF79
MESEFAIVTFRKSGPIKTASAVRATNVHNARTKPLKHAIVGAPEPRFLVGTNNLLKDITRALADVEIDFRKPRKNGVLAYEAILSASAAFFERGTEEERAARLELWIKDQVAWAIKRYGANRVVSMVLHLDEKTPHIHLVILPLTVTVDGRRSDRTPRWGLVGRTISGPGMYDQVQDDYAAAMAHFGLVRGIKGSGRKHEPVVIYLARMAAKEKGLDVAREAADKARAAHEAKVAEDEKRIAAEWADIRRQLTEIADDRARTKRTAEKVNAHRDRLMPLFKAATEFRKSLDAVEGLPLTRTASDARGALAGLQVAASATVAPTYETQPAMLASYANIRQHAAALGR